MNNEPAFVSVIIPFLNGAAWLPEAIESVIIQTHTHWQAILVDDGSDEPATNIAKSYSKQFPGKIIYTDHPEHANKGVTISRNVGIGLATGAFIAFLDADDCWLPEKLEAQLEIFRQMPSAAMVCEASRFWYSWNNLSSKDELIPVGATPGLYKPRELARQLYPLGTGAPPCPTGVIIRKDAFYRSGGFEPAFSGAYQLYEDQAFLMKIYLRENVFVSGIAHNLYRKRPGSLTGTAADEKHYKKVRLFYLDWLRNYMEQQQLNDSELFQLIEQARQILND